MVAIAAAIASPALAAGAGDFVSPGAGGTLTGGSIAEARWRPLDADAGRNPALDEAELVLSLDGGRTFPIRVSAELPPGATAYHWRVPSLASRSARLALRVGAAHERGRERLVRISGEFAIAAGAAEPLAAVADESWTEQALFERTPGDLLGGAMRAERERLVATGSESDADDTDPAAPLVSPDSRPAARVGANDCCIAVPTRTARPGASSLPLRL